MKNPILALFRWNALRKNRSTVPTSLLSLKKVKSAMVFVDALTEGEDPAPVSQAIQQFFDDRGIPVRILCPQKEDVNLFGWLKPRVRGSRKDPRTEDLFISLALSPDNFAAEYEARCSTACFKVGCFALPGGVFDLVVEPPKEGGSDQGAAFSAIIDYLNKIQ